MILQQSSFGNNLKIKVEIFISDVNISTFSRFGIDGQRVLSNQRSRSSLRLTGSCIASYNKFLHNCN